MPILLVPPTGAAGSNVVFLCLPVVFVYFYFIFVCFAVTLCDFHFSSFLRLISLIEGVVWRGWMTSLLCLFRTVWRRGAGHSWRTLDDGGRQGSKVPGGPAGRPWLCYSYHKLLPLPGACLVLCLVCLLFFPWFLVLLCWRLVVFSSFSFFFQLVLFKCLPRPLRGGTMVCCYTEVYTYTRYIFVSFFCFFSLSNCLCFCFCFFSLFRFCFSRSWNVYVVPVVRSMMTWHCIAYVAT